jgi:hypothetical protein
MVIGIVLGAVLSEPLQQLPNWVSYRLDHGWSSEPDCSDTGWYREVEADDVASYGQYEDYSAINTVDEDRRTAWVVRITGDPTKDWISWSFLPAANIRLICVRNGYTKTWTSMSGNQRVRTLEVAGCGGVAPITLNDRIDLTPPPGTWPGSPGLYDTLSADECSTTKVIFTIKSTYPAADASSTVAIADVKF